MWHSKQGLSVDNVASLPLTVSANLRLSKDPIVSRIAPVPTTTNLTAPTPFISTRKLVRRPWSPVTPFGNELLASAVDLKLEEILEWMRLGVEYPEAKVDEARKSDRSDAARTIIL